MSDKGKLAKRHIKSKKYVQIFSATVTLAKYYIGKALRSDSYCSECGAPMQVTVVGAEECSDLHYGPMHSKYDDKTGHRNMVLRRRCPKSRWYNGHSDWTSSELLKEAK